jgi:pre-mRNA-processing factor 19
MTSKLISKSIIIHKKMSLSVCAISGKPLQNPVLSIKTGHLYEKEVIEKHLSSFPYCPLTNQPMQISDLIDIARIMDSI